MEQHLHERTHEQHTNTDTHEHIVKVMLYSLSVIRLLPQRVCCPWLRAMPVQHLRAPEQAREDTSPEKIDVTSKSPVGDISVVTLIRTDTTLDHSQKAEKVWRQAETL